MHNSTAEAGGHTLVLRHVDFHTVEYLVESTGAPDRVAVVRVGSGPSWRQAVQFPNFRSEGGQSTGDAGLDEAIRVRAAEELVRLEGFVQVVNSGARAA